MMVFTAAPIGWQDFEVDESLSRRIAAINAAQPEEPMTDLVVYHNGEMHDMDGRLVYPRAAGIHTVQVRTACRKVAQPGRLRDFSPENGGYESAVFRIRILPGD
jgi:hypothetical protein